ncbi:MAG TPA: LPS assembly lipoprotein LptE [Sphingomonas sp.]|nr:LPS assembly lipoprotein LptE [Sphingomonas sp.]
MMRLARLGLVVPILLGLAGCGLQPMYAGGSHGPVARTLSDIEVGPIGGQQGWLMRNALIDRLGATGHGKTRYRLDVILDDQITGFGIRSNNSVTRERRSLRARFKLIDASNQQVLLETTAGSDAGIDVVTSEYAVIAAEQTALERLSGEVAEQIVSRVALYARRHPPTE